MSTSLWYDIKTQFLQSSSKLTQLIVVNILVFVLLGLARLFFFLMNDLNSFDRITDYVGLSPHIPTAIRHIWTLITYAFVHLSLFHLLFNMLVLYWMGLIFTEYLGEKRLWPLYMMASWCGGLLYIAVYNLFPVFQVSSLSPTMIGASAGVLGIVVATATLLPDYTMYLLIIGPVRLKWIALAMIVIDIISIPFGNAGGHLAHIGGAAFGLLFVRFLQNGTDVSLWLQNIFSLFAPSGKKRRHLKVMHGEKNYRTKNEVRTIAEQEADKRVDDILDKISKSGYESLSQEEKTYLFNYSNKK
jgi:membrane associated rhomboid family serine protease